MTRFVFQGSGRTTGPDLSGLIGAGVLVGAVIGVAVAVIEFAAVIAAVLIAVVVLAAGLLTWWLLTQPARKARFDAAYRAAFTAREEASRAHALQRQQFAVELARASAPQIQNVIDPAPFVAAALAALGVQPQPEPVRAVRGEVER